MNYFKIFFFFADVSFSVFTGNEWLTGYNFREFNKEIIYRGLGWVKGSN